MSAARCDFELLDKSGSAEIEVCRRCGCVAIHVGPMTMRVDLASFDALTQSMRRAAQVLSQESTHTSSRPSACLVKAQPLYLSIFEQLRLSTGALGILLFVTSVSALRFAPHRFELCALMATLSFLALAFAFSGRAA